MITEIFQVILWITVIMLVISGLDDILIDTMYWFFRKKYKDSLPTFADINSKPERAIAVMIGAWREERVIGRTLTIALKKLRYTNFRIFVAVYPNDLKTVKVVREIARKDSRVVLCLNPQDGPTTKADNLNNSFTCIKEYERQFGEFDIILIHDSEDFIHPLSLKLYNYLIMYKGNYAVQIPVIPIKNKLGKLFHRTYCDTFAELHTKDMIVRQSVGSFIPFAGTGMAFNRKAFHYLETESIETEQRLQKYKKEHGKIPGEEIYLQEETDVEREKANSEEYGQRFESDPYPEYDDIPIPGWDDDEKKRSDLKPKSQVRQYSVLLLTMIIMAGVFVFYSTNASSMLPEEQEAPAEEIIPADASVLKDAGIGNSAVNETAGVKNNDAVSNKIEITAASSSTLKGKTEPVKNTTQSNELTNSVQDGKIDVYYDVYSSGNVKLLESSWNRNSDAFKRAEMLKKYTGSRNKNVEVSTVTINGKEVYKVYVVDFSSVDDAKDFAGGLRKSLRRRIN